MKSKVAIMKTAPETVIDDYGKIMRAAGYEESLDKKKKTHLMLNLSWDLWYPACSTTPWQLEGVTSAMMDDGFGDDAIMFTQNPANDVDDRTGETNNGLATVAERYGLSFTRLQERPVEWVRYEPGVDLLILDKLCEEGIQVPEIFPGTNIIQLPTMKTHNLIGLAGAMKNVLGGFSGGRHLRSEDVIHQVIVDVLAIQQEMHAGIFAVMDGTFCGDGPGPRVLMPYEKDFILASSDLVALDAVAAKIMGFDPMAIEYIRLADERGIGCGDLSGIEIEGEDISEVDFHFYGQEKGLLCRIGRSALNGSYRGAARYCLDYYWYPYVGWPRVSRMAETKWGQMLQEYLPAGSELENQGKGKLPFAAVAGGAILLGMSATRRITRLARIH